MKSGIVFGNNEADEQGVTACWSASSTSTRKLTGSALAADGDDSFAVSMSGSSRYRPQVSSVGNYRRPQAATTKGATEAPLKSRSFLRRRGWPQLCGKIRVPGRISAVHSENDKLVDEKWLPLWSSVQRKSLDHSRKSEPWPKRWRDFWIRQRVSVYWKES